MQTVNVGTSEHSFAIAENFKGVVEKVHCNTIWRNT